LSGDQHEEVQSGGGVAWISEICTDEISVTWRNRSFFIDRIKYVIKTAALKRYRAAKVASGKHLEEAADTTQLESTMSFWQIWASMSLQEKICHVQHKICRSKRKTVFVRLEAVANADNPCSLLQVIRRGLVIAKSGSQVYMIRCNLVEVLLGSATIAQMRWRNISFFIDRIKYVIKTASSPTR
jgi:hypothetical protein